MTDHPSNSNGVPLPHAAIHRDDARQNLPVFGAHSGENLSSGPLIDDLIFDDPEQTGTSEDDLNPERRTVIWYLPMTVSRS